MTDLKKDIRRIERSIRRQMKHIAPSATIEQKHASMYT
jgi:hypothetical protein